MAKKLHKTPSVLAFTRKLESSDALFFAGRWNNRTASGNWKSIPIIEKSVRGTISNSLKTDEQDPAKLDPAIENANLQTVDVAALPVDADTMKASFTLRVLKDVGEPSSCNVPDYRKKLIETVLSYEEKVGFGELASRYARNLASARFLWRNRIGAESVEVHIEHLADGAAKQEWSFDALQIPLLTFEAPSNADVAKNLSMLSNLIADGFSGRQNVLLSVSAYARLGKGQEVFPSQELILNRDAGRTRGKKSKTLYQVEGIAGMHSQKIGNAVRTIDTWYQGSDENGPIAVEPYGAVTSQSFAYRPKGKDDFYTLFHGWVLKDKVLTTEQQHFVIATLIRGGVFGDAKDKD